eukprot:g4515.t1
MSWQATLKYWAEKAGCAELDFVGTSQFARVWTYSLIYALVMTVGITVPFRWCSRGKAAVKIYDAPPEDDPEEGVDESSPKTARTNKTNKTYKTYDASQATDPTPNLEDGGGRARKHLIHTSATTHHQWLSPLWTPTYRLSEIGGTGTELYFRTLRNLAFIFAYMAGITGPLLAFCWLGTFGPDTGQFLLKTTIGNLGEYVEADVIDPWNRVVRLGCEGMELVKLTGIFGWLDFSAVIVFLIYLIWARFYQIPRMAEADDLEQVTPKDYALTIESLPATIPNQQEYEQRLEQHLLERLRYTRGRRPSPWELPEPSIEEIVLVRDYKGRLHELTERAKLEISVGIAKAHAKGKLGKSVDKLEAKKLNEKLASKLDGEDLLPVVRAYVILSNTEDVQNLLFDYRFAKYKLFRCCQFRSRRFEGTAIRVTRAPQPTDIIWENQDIGFYNRLLRQIAVFLIFFIILSISIAFIYLTTVASKATSKTQVSYLGVPECDPVDQIVDLEGKEQYKCLVQVAANWTIDYATSEGGDILSCWCTAQGYEALISNSAPEAELSGDRNGIVAPLGKLDDDLASKLLGQVNVWEQEGEDFTALFAKYPHNATGVVAPECLTIIGAHQDRTYWGIEPESQPVVSVWVAVDNATKENGAMQFFPGTHKNKLPHVIGLDECSALADSQGIPEVHLPKNAISAELTLGLSFSRSNCRVVKRVACVAAFVPLPALRNACGPWFLELATSIGIATGSSVIVTVINLILQLVITYLAEFERPLSHTALNSSMIQKAFWAQTLNTGFVLFVVNYFAPEALRNLVLAIPGVGFLLFRGPFAEITRGWYAVVGVTLVTNMVINAFVPASVTIAKMFVTSFMRCCKRGRVAHQAELIELYTNPEFDIKQKYAQLLTTIFVTVIYGSGLPLLYFLAAVFMFMQFWADKYNLLWGSRRPPAYDTKMAKEAIDSMFYAIPFHCILAILMFGQTCVFPSDPIGGDLGDLANQGARESPGMLAQFFPQFTRESTWMFVILLALLIVLWVCRLLAWIIGGGVSTASDFLVALCCPRWRKSQPSMDEIKAALKKGERQINGHTIDVAATMNWDRAFGHIEQTFPPASYRFERHPQLKSIAHLLRPSSPSRPNTSRTESGEGSTVPEPGELGGTAAASGLRPAAEANASPVPETAARGFLKALEAEYLQGTQNAVGDFFSTADIDDSKKDALAKIEDEVRASEQREKKISELRTSWGYH